MLQARDLRLGNWVDYDGKGSYSKIYAIGDTHVGTGVNNVLNRPLWHCTPIPLTPEILEKCGFVTQSIASTMGSSSHLLIKDGVLICVNYKITPKNELVFESITHNQIEVKSVHQLQNLYFALTGEELEISL